MAKSLAVLLALLPVLLRVAADDQFCTEGQEIMYESVTLPAPGVYNVTCEANTRVLKVWKCVDGCGELVSCGEPVRGTTSGSRRIRCQVQVDKQTMYFCTKANFNEADQPFKYFNISIAPLFVPTNRQPGAQVNTTESGTEVPSTTDETPETPISQSPDTTHTPTTVTSMGTKVTESTGTPHDSGNKIFTVIIVMTVISIMLCLAIVIICIILAAVLLRRREGQRNGTPPPGNGNGGGPGIAMSDRNNRDSDPARSQASGSGSGSETSEAANGDNNHGGIQACSESSPCDNAELYINSQKFIFLDFKPQKPMQESHPSDNGERVYIVPKLFFPYKEIETTIDQSHDNNPPSVCIQESHAFCDKQPSGDEAKVLENEGELSNIESDLSSSLSKANVDLAKVAVMSYTFNEEECSMGEPDFVYTSASIQQLLRSFKSGVPAERETNDSTCILATKQATQEMVNADSEEHQSEDVGKEEITAVINCEEAGSVHIDDSHSVDYDIEQAFLDAVPSHNDHTYTPTVPTLSARRHRTRHKDCTRTGTDAINSMQHEYSENPYYVPSAKNMEEGDTNNSHNQFGVGSEGDPFSYDLHPVPETVRHSKLTIMDSNATTESNNGLSPDGQKSLKEGVKSCLGKTKNMQIPPWTMPNHRPLGKNASITYKPTTTRCIPINQISSLIDTTGILVN